MATVKRTVSISEAIVNEAKIVSPNFSSVVEVALKEYLQHYRLQKALKSFGAWAKRQESSVDLVNKLREEDK